MEHAKPAILDNIEIMKSELVSSELKAHKKPEPGRSGHIRYSVKITPELIFPESREGNPVQMRQKAEVTLQAYTGDPENETDVTEELACCKVELAVLYRMGQEEYTEDEYMKYQWYFQACVSLIARSYVRDLLKDTDFSSIPVPFGT